MEFALSSCPVVTKTFPPVPMLPPLLLSISSQQGINLDAAAYLKRDVAAVVDLPVRILNNQIKIVHSGEISADVHGNISTRSDMRARFVILQARKLSRRTVRVIARDVECEIGSAGDGGAGQNRWCLISPCR